MTVSPSMDPAWLDHGGKGDGSGNGVGQIRGKWEDAPRVKLAPAFPIGGRVCRLWRVAPANLRLRAGSGGWIKFSCTATQGCPALKRRGLVAWPPSVPPSLHARPTISSGYLPHPHHGMLQSHSRALMPGALPDGQHLELAGSG